jgi:hypothetical protein
MGPYNNSRMTVLAVAAALAVWPAGCNRKVSVPAGARVIYEDHLNGTSVVLGRPLRDRIVAQLNRPPDSAQRRTGMGLDARRYLHVDGRTFQVLDHDLVLLDDRGVRSWHIPNIGADLSAAAQPPTTRKPVTDAARRSG